MKKKKSWKSPALSQANRSKEDKLRDTLKSIISGESRLLKHTDDLYEALANGLDDIESFENPKDQLELLAWTLQTDTLSLNAPAAEREYWNDLYYDAGTFFVEVASQFEDKSYVSNLIHDLALCHSGVEGRSVVFLSIADIMPAETATALLGELISIEKEYGDNREDVLDAICDMADSVHDSANYAKAALLKDPDKSNATILDIANAYFVAGDLVLAKQWMNDVHNPAHEDEEAFLDLQAAIADREGRKSDCLKIARQLYENYPKVINLGRYASLLSDADADHLLEEHERFRCGKSVDMEFMQLLAGMKRYKQLSSYVDRFENELTTLDADELSELADSIEKDDKKLADHIRDWIVEEPEEAEAFDDKD